MSRSSFIRTGVGLLAAALLLAALPALARPQAGKDRPKPAEMQERFAEADKDGNGALSKEEFQSLPGPHRGPRGDELFKRLDKNNDGQIQKSELEAMRQEHEARRKADFDKADKNGDGRLSFEEFANMRPEHGPGPGHDPLKDFDANHDGRIQRSELPSLGAREDASPPPPPPSQDQDRKMVPGEPDMPPPPPPMEEQGQDMQRHDGDAPPPPPADHRGPPRDPEKWFSEADANGDGVLDSTELTQGREKMLHKHFERMDADHDGFLQLSELRPMGGPRPPHPGEEEGLREQTPGSEAVGLADAQSQNDGSISLDDRQSSNYPNPFNSVTTIYYQIPTDAHVTLAVYNLNGELVSTLVDADQSSGAYQVRLDLSGQTSGTYFCRMQAGSLISVRRMMYIK